MCTCTVESLRRDIVGEREKHSQRIAIKHEQFEEALERAEKAEKQVETLTRDLAQAQSDRQREHDLRVKFQGEVETLTRERDVDRNLLHDASKRGDAYMEGMDKAREERDAAIAAKEKAERIISDADTELIKSSGGRDYQFSIAQHIKFLNEGMKSNYERLESCNKLWNEERTAKEKAERDRDEWFAKKVHDRDLYAAQRERDALQARVDELIVGKGADATAIAMLEQNNDALQARVLELEALFADAKAPSKEVDGDKPITEENLQKWEHLWESMPCMYGAIQPLTLRIRELQARIAAMTELLRKIAGTRKELNGNATAWRVVTNDLVNQIDAALKAAADASPDQKPGRFYILSLKHTKGGDSQLTWWRPDSRGYCWSLTHAGLYEEAEAKQIENGSMHDGMRSNVAVPEEIARELAYSVIEINDSNFQKLGTSANEWRKAGRL